MRNQRAMGAMRAMGLAAQAAVLALSAGGCAGDLNRRAVLGGGVEIPALDPREPAELGVMSLAGPRAERIDRGDWDPQTYLVPVDGTVHGPDWQRAAGPIDPLSARALGLFPTTGTAVEAGSRPGREALEAVVEWAGTIIEPAFLVVRSVSQPPWSAVQSPTRSWKRTAQTAWYPGPLPEPLPEPQAEPGRVAAGPIAGGAGGDDGAVRRAGGGGDE